MTITTTAMREVEEGVKSLKKKNLPTKINKTETAFGARKINEYFYLANESRDTIGVVLKIQKPLIYSY